MTKIESTRNLEPEQEIEEAKKVLFWKAEMRTEKNHLCIGLPCAAIIHAVENDKNPFGVFLSLMEQTGRLLDYLRRGPEVMEKLQEAFGRFEDKHDSNKGIFIPIELVRFVQFDDEKFAPPDLVGLRILRSFIPSSVVRLKNFLIPGDCLYKFIPIKEPPVYFLKEEFPEGKNKRVSIVISFLVADSLSIIEHFPNDVHFVDLTEIDSFKIDPTKLTQPNCDPLQN